MAYCERYDHDIIILCIVIYISERWAGPCGRPHNKQMRLSNENTERQVGGVESNESNPKLVSVAAPGQTLRDNKISGDSLSVC